MNILPSNPLVLRAVIVAGVLLFANAPWNAAAADNDVIPQRQDHLPNQPLSPAESVSKMTVPEGFKLELVAGEPDIVNPLAMTFDDRGRLWLTESVEYPRKSAGPGQDRIKIVEGVTADGRAEKISTFAEGLNIPSGIAVGYGGVWVLNAPDLLFIREKDGKEAGREVVVTGFGRTDTHELPNSLTWGPDGWLYGCNGVFNQSKVHSNNGKDYEFTCALWRIHPVTHEFQIVCEGTSNPWGIAWDSEGSAIVEACHWANDHLFHFVETGQYQRQAGAYPPFTARLGSITTQSHQKTAYCGIAWLDTDAIPAPYRDRIVVGNVHAGCLNMDRLERDGATYLARGEPDFISSNDDWCMPVSLKIGPDGCLYVLDWYDRYHCSQDAARDPEGVDRMRGRLYRLRYRETPRAPQFDLARETDEQLIARLASPNIYFRERAQRLLSERLAAAGGNLRGKLEKTVLGIQSETPDAQLTRLPSERKQKLHALWALIGSGSLSPAFHERLLADPDATVRAWSVRAAGEFGQVEPALREKIAALARDPSPDVELQAAIAAPKLKGADAVAMITDVLARCGQDKIIPSIAWNSLHPLLETNAARFVALATAGMGDQGPSAKPVLPPAVAAISSLAVDRLLSAPKPDCAATVAFVRFVAAHDEDRGKDCLSAISARLGALSESATAELKTALQPAIAEILARGTDTPLALSAKVLGAHLGLVQFDPAEVRATFTDARQPEAARLQALDALIAFRDPGLLRAVDQVLGSDSPRFLGRMLGALGHVEDPKLADVILRAYPALAPELQTLAVDLIMEREPWARKLLNAVLSGQIPRGALNANHLRKIMDSNDREAIWSVEKVFGQVREERNPAREKVVAEMGVYLREHVGDPKRGQAVFHGFCAQCHMIYGEGARVGPDITANGRANFDQLLSNVFDPSLVIGPAYVVTTVVTTDGRNLTGLIAEDNEQRVVIRVPGGADEAVPRNMVKYMRASKLSMMPEGIELILSKDALADLFAFLSLDKPPDDPAAKLIPGAPSRSTPPAPAASPQKDARIRLTPGEQSLSISARLPDGDEWRELASYVMNPALRPYLHPVRDSSGQVVLTEDRPADHPWQHGIFTGFHGTVNGHEYWMEKDGAIRFRRLLGTETSDDRVGWRALSELVEPPDRPVLEEEDHVVIHAPESDHTYLIDFDMILRAKDQAVIFDRNKVGGLAVRMLWDKDNPQQNHLNSNGDRGRSCEGRRAAWCNVERPFGDRRFGIAAFDFPGNTGFPSAWRVDEQGLIDPAVTGLEPWTLPAGQERLYRYRLLVYEGAASVEMLQQRFEAFAAPVPAPQAAR